jgi:hypothetical protein
MKMSHWIMGILAGISGLIGFFMAAGAHDPGIFWFGLTLAAFGVLFGWWMIKTAYDESEALRAAVDPDQGRPQGEERTSSARNLRSAA